MSRDDQPELDPALADAVRRAYVRPVDEGTAQRHVNAMIAASAAAGDEPVARRSPRRRSWRVAVTATATTLLLPAGLALAGVSLPGAVEEPYRFVGITLPHQSPRTPAVPTPARTIPTPTTSPAPANSATTTPRAPEQPAARPHGAQGPRQTKPAKSIPTPARPRPETPKAKPAPARPKNTPAPRRNPATRPVPKAQPRPSPPANTNGRAVRPNR